MNGVYVTDYRNPPGAIWHLGPMTRFISVKHREVPLMAGSIVWKEKRCVVL